MLRMKLLSVLCGIFFLSLSMQQPLFAYTDEGSASVNMGLSLSAVTGSRTLLGIRDGITGLENLSAEKYPLKIDDGLRMLLRGIGLIVFELPVDYLLMTLQHEFFGHGSRCREYGGHPAYLYTTAPWPYGAGHAGVFCVNGDLTGMQRHILNIGGVTSNDVMREDIAMKWVASGAISGPSTWLYTLSAMQTTGYLWVAGLVLKATEPSRTDLGDMTNYVTHINRLYQRDDAISLESLKNLSLVNLLDPMLFNSFYGMYHHVRYGKDAPLWMIPFGSRVHYLPTLKMAFTPFGPDFTMHNYFVLFDRAIDARIHGGVLGANSYWGVGITGQAWRYETLTLGGHLEIFRQPDIREDADFHYKPGLSPQRRGDFDRADPGFGDQAWGFLATVNSSWRFVDPCALDIEIGGKTKGHVPGEVIGSSFLLRGGLTLYF